MDSLFSGRSVFFGRGDMPPPLVESDLNGANGVAASEVESPASVEEDLGASVVRLDDVEEPDVTNEEEEDDDDLSVPNMPVAPMEEASPGPVSILKKRGRPSASASASRTGTPARSRPATATSEKAAEAVATAAASSKKRKAGRPADGAPAAKRVTKRATKPATAPSRPISARKAATAAKQELKVGPKRQAAGEKPAKKTPGKRGRPAATKVQEDEGESWEVEAILDDGIDDDSKQHLYFVKWKGFADSDNTWEPKYNLKGAQELLKTYEKTKKTQTAGKRRRKAKT